MGERAAVSSGATSTGEVRAPGLVEALAVWALLGLHLVAVFVTYARLPPARLYNVSGHGLAGGASRVLVELNFPTALAAIAILGLVAARWLATLPARSAARRRWSSRACWTRRSSGRASSRRATSMRGGSTRCRRWAWR